MKFRNLFVLPIAVILVATLATSRWLAAQVQTEEHSKKEHHHYTLIDLGTLGGPHSYGSVNGDGFQLLNNAGVVASSADTALSDPNAPNSCFDPDCFRAHAFRWEDGVMTDLGALAGNYSSAAGSINARGWAAGQSQTGLFDPILHGPGVHAVLWKKGQIIDLGSLDGNASLGIYVNEAGQVIGLSDNTTPDPFSMFGIGVSGHSFGRTEYCRTSAHSAARTRCQARAAAANRAMWLSDCRIQVSLPTLPQGCPRWTLSCGRTAK